MDELIWILVEDELPEYQLPVLFWNAGTVDHEPGCYVGWYSNKEYDGFKGRWFDIYNNPIYAGVTHWAALPKGPDCTLRVGLKLLEQWTSR